MLQSNSYDGAGDKSGLYMITDTNSGNPTYYFRGNNYWGGIIKDGAIASLSTYYKNAMVLPVISLKANVIVADKGTVKDHYVVS